MGRDAKIESKEIPTLKEQVEKDNPQKEAAMQRKRNRTDF